MSSGPDPKVSAGRVLQKRSWYLDALRRASKYHDLLAATGRDIETKLRELRSPGW
jgi:hypothetical protein